MSASSSPASTTLSRSKIAVAFVAAIATVYGIYYIHSSNLSSEVTTKPDASSGLHRTNAIRRRHRRPTPRDGEGTQDHADSSHDEANDTDDESDLIEGRRQADGETIVDEDIYDEFEDPSWNRQRAGQHMVQLLFRISEDATKRNAYVHRGTLCNACGVVPIRGIRYRCANCADYDLCEACESQGHHYRTHVFYKIRVPISNYAPRQLQSAFYPGDPDTAVKMLPRELTTRLTKETGLDRPEIEAYWEQWTYMANTEWREDPDALYLAMDRRTFDRCLVPSDGNRYAAPNLIHDRMFAYYDQNNDELISFPEYLQGLAFRKSKNKLRRVFDGYDINGDGYVDRKDFLRMFRSYYVLYKNMRKDMLDSMDEHAVNSVEAHQLVHSRQPLSSAFGRDGRFGNASNPRIPGEGKQLNPDGDLEIIDGKGIVYPSGDDHGDKADVFRDPLGRAMNDFPPDTTANYWGVVSSPPRTLESLQGRVLENILTGRSQENVFNIHNRIGDLDHADDTDPNWPPGIVEPCDISEVLGVAMPFEQVPRSQRAKIIEEASRRVLRNAHSEQEAITNNRMHERWRRRQFYTDEEEGAEAPADWKAEEDVPNGDPKLTDTSQRPALSPRSRSSSKVRFAEDMDDYETRSNPSTSSRSVPERWGGMEIPDAEKDAGKDVLYQVSQQAFNELLDNLFRNQEEAAISSLSSKKTRAQHRHLFTNVYFDFWAERVDISYAEKDNKEPEDHDRNEDGDFTNIQNEIKLWNDDPSDPAVEVEETRQLPLDVLLSESGYSVEPGANGAGSADASGNNTSPRDISITERQGSPTASEDLRHNLLDSLRGPIPDQTEPRLPTDEDEFTDMLQSYRDPTLPQFRPSHAAPLAPSFPLSAPQDAALPTTETPEQAHHEGSDRTNHDRSRTSKRGGKTHRSSRTKNPTASSPLSPPPKKTPLRDLQKELLSEMKDDASIPAEVYRSLTQWDWMALYKLREMENTETEARKRGGWGRLSWSEFEDILRLRDRAWRAEKRELLEGGVKAEPGKRITKREQDVERMAEYLGSWIELCIP